MNASGILKAAVVATSEVVRTGLAQMLEQAVGVDGYAVFEPEEFAAEAREDAIQLLILSCHVLILWSVNGSGHGEDAWTAELAAVARENGILVVLVLPGAEMDRAAAGMVVPCDGILDQDALTTDGLSCALKRLASGERFVMEPTARAAQRTRKGDVTPMAGVAAVLLTAREQHVLELLVEGRSNKQIGQALAFSEHSAKRLVAIVLSKLNCPNRTQAVAVALREGLVGADAGFRGIAGRVAAGRREDRTG
ncbi:LuxR C-terminal-related transcriptional regulator [Streptomyces sp. NBC_01387]|uniref:response regulator transcription factor n=1 Tax=unclassified Streptomyces TaxID=2593676 RepID=UPI002024D8C1|nr:MULTISPECIES: LuxR C-terminal-related transcriptional regulator [unclassified Streptomyces]MCX4547556.1 LuxR C-terminal-related transcriptional regulator [Streptomyces sp. NBC_01500]WSC19244.1 LuxR C-terminal-related transcriptional regulator [Streptomyces sp. NBC_01766]WSV53267.1 LuxR C-terminal-related transcriptional regulator [Streptomyces sp. NBC_01014]